MCMKCGCCNGNHEVEAPIIAPNGSKGSERIVQPTDAQPTGRVY